MNTGVVTAFIKKEFKQIIRDNSSILIAFVLPLILLFLFGFGINFDTNTVRIGIVNQDNTPETRDIVQSMLNTRYLECIFFKTDKRAAQALSGGKIRGYAVIPVNFTNELKKGAKPVIQIITDGTEPNTAKFAASYIQGAVSSYTAYKLAQTGQGNAAINNLQGAFNRAGFGVMPDNAPEKADFSENTEFLNAKINAAGPAAGKIDALQRAWYNPALKSTYFILPGSLAIIMTMTGTVLTALVVAREWERGTMEALLTTEITKSEFIFSKYAAYFILGVLSIVFCLFIITAVFKVPFRGSYFALLIVSSLFMLTGIGAGLLISTVFKDQFVSSQVAGTVGFMPSMMLSGLIYEIDSMPLPIRWLSSLIPARYYVSSISSLFLSGTILKTLILDSLYLLIFSLVMFILIYKNTNERIEEC